MGDENRIGGQEGEEELLSENWQCIETECTGIKGQDTAHTSTITVTVNKQSIYNYAINNSMIQHCSMRHCSVR